MRASGRSRSAVSSSKHPVVDLNAVPERAQAEGDDDPGAVEIEKGVERLPVGSKKSTAQASGGRALHEWRGRIVTVDEIVALEWGRLLARAESRGQSLPVVDALIGASAIVRGLTVVTRNESGIARTGPAVFDPWQPQ